MPDDCKSKYHRNIASVSGMTEVVVDIYAVLTAYAVTCPARQHAAKKLLCAGLRGKGDALQDLQEAAVAVQRAIELEQTRLLWGRNCPPVPEKRKPGRPKKIKTNE